MATETTGNTSAAPLSKWAIPGLLPEDLVQIQAQPGRITSVVGANGAGKSALGIWMTQNSAAIRLSAHRRLWFRSAGPEISTMEREDAISNGRYYASQPDARYVDHEANQRTSIVLFDLLVKLNAENAALADLVMNGADRAALDHAATPRILDRLNEILNGAGLPITLVLTDKQTFNATNQSRGVEYPIFQMSDGEKSAVLLAAEVLAAPTESVLVIDEPERHLHRSISAGLVEAVSESRPDCHFVVLTHDLELVSALEKRNGDTYVLTDCVWNGDEVVGWDLHPVDAAVGITDGARQAILGGRQDVLFIEGRAESLDNKLYRLLFPGWQLSPAGGGEEVVRAVGGLRSSGPHHWIRAQGVVDGDGRSPAERASLISRGVLPLPVSEVESLYYLDVVISAIAAAQGTALEKPVTRLIQETRAKSLSALRQNGNFERFAEKLALAEVRRRIVDAVPTGLDASKDEITISAPSSFVAILAEIERLSAANDLDGLVRLLPIRDTAMRNQVANTLGYRSTSDYEAAVRVRVKNDPALAKALKDVVGPLPM